MASSLTKQREEAFPDEEEESEEERASSLELIEKLRQAIAEGELQPGLRLKELALARKYHTTRAAVREALNALQGEMLVRHLPTGGFSVAEVSLAQAEDIYGAREVLEGLAARLFTERATPNQIEKLGDAIKAFAEEAEKEPLDIDTLLKAKTHVYNVLLGECGNVVIQWILRSLRIRIADLRKRTLSSPGRPKQTAKELGDIFREIEARQPEKAERASIEHVRLAAKVAYNELRRRSTP